MEPSRYRDVDAVILTGVAGTPAEDEPPTGLGTVGLALQPARLDPEFAEASFDPGYLTTKPGTRYDAFYAPADADPAVVAFDEATKGTGSASDLALVVGSAGETAGLRLPMLLATGVLDSIVCNRSGCTEADLRSWGRARFGSAPIDVLVLPYAGHDINLMPNAATFFERAQAWVRTSVGSRQVGP